MHTSLTPTINATSVSSTLALSLLPALDASHPLATAAANVSATSTPIGTRRRLCDVKHDLIQITRLVFLASDTTVQLPLAPAAFPRAACLPLAVLSSDDI